MIFKFELKDVLKWLQIGVFSFFLSEKKEHILDLIKLIDVQSTSPKMINNDYIKIKYKDPCLY